MKNTGRNKIISAAVWLMLAFGAAAFGQEPADADAALLEKYNEAETLYSQAVASRNQGTVESMRAAQKAMIEGKLKSSGKQAGCRSDVVKLDGAKQAEFKCNANAPFAHPHYWSSFVLIGNWR